MGILEADLQAEISVILSKDLTVCPPTAFLLSSVHILSPCKRFCVQMFSLSALFALFRNFTIGCSDYFKVVKGEA